MAIARDERGPGVEPYSGLCEATVGVAGVFAEVGNHQNLSRLGNLGAGCFFTREREVLQADADC